MEAIEELASNQAPRLGQISNASFEPVPLSRTLRAVPPAGRFGDDSSSQPESDGGGSGDLARCPELLKSIGSTAVDDAALLSFREAADFADNVEEVSRAVDYLQIVAAGAVERTRREAAVAARSAAVGSGSGSGAAIGWGADTAVASQAPRPAESELADDGYRNATEFLRARLRISAAEARRRISLAAAVLPRAGFAGHTDPAERPELAAAVAAGTVASRPASIITAALDRVRHHATGDTTARMEHALTRTATEHDTDFLTRVARRWTDAIDQDGSEPSEEELRRRQGVFLRPARRGLHHLEIFATPDQYEPLLTVMNTATNPRTRAGTTEGSDAGSDAGNDADSAADSGDGTGGGPDADLDRRTRPQRLLDGLVGACKAALTTGTLPAAGGLRPQVMVTIDYRDLLDRLEHTTAKGPRYRSRTTATNPGYDGPDNDSNDYGNAGHPGHTGPVGAGLSSSGSPAGIPGTGSFTFTGPVAASVVRKIACDADIIPVLLGSQGRVLDIGRTTRIFPPHIRKAITARDQGCAFPGCTIPAPWCEAHHISYWSHGGNTSTDNGTLLCSHHHHLIHKEQWTIQVKTGMPWFIPPPHIDPRQRPQQNNYFKT
ncbi:HNH endonuclease signature motif containing protein [Arthrobacter sp. ISL-69]|uniref:HNH endonuclease signature motif containing protein n=1 Tax=Arthrobacter sp. ISL-69 TaxID=2819113 RepID=UPI0020356C94|nr:HNH endonuclease signature motif containing protein [Arthrobacter sp. ISL-69]